MKYILSIIIFSLLSLFSTNNKNIDIVTYWKKGDTQKIVVKEGFIEYEGEEEVKKEVTSSYVEITVLEETDSTYLIEWLYFDDQTDRLNVEVEEEDPMDKRIEEMFSTTKFLYQTNELGVFDSVLNLEEILQSMNDSLEVMFREEFVKDKSDELILIEVMKSVEEMIFSERLKQELTNAIANYHAYHGDILVADTLIHYDGEVENKLGGDAIPVKGVTQTKTDTKEKIISITNTQTFESEEVKEAIDEGTKKIKMQKRKKLMQELEKNDLIVKDLEIFNYDYEFGWLKYFEKSRTFTSGNKRKVNFTIIEEWK